MSPRLVLLLSALVLAACGDKSAPAPATPTPAAPAVPSVVDRETKQSPIQGGAFPGTRFDDLPAATEDHLILLYAHALEGEIEPCG